MCPAILPCMELQLNSIKQGKFFISASVSLSADTSFLSFNLEELKVNFNY
jgi:hypothetical protein